MISDNNYRVNSNTTAPLKENVGVPVLGRVIDVITDKDHPLYNTYGGVEAIGAVLFKDLNNNVDTSEDGETVISGVAYPISTNINTQPLKNEIILIQIGPSSSVNQGISNNNKAYYKTTFSIWNHPHHNSYPADNTQEEVNLNEAMVPNSKLAPLLSFPGDTLIQGRLSQSIRLGGTATESNKLTNDSNVDSPFTLISNGQKPALSGFNYIVEDINNDPSSIYLTSNHTVPLTLANSKRASYNEAPDTPNKYQGSQVLVNADRITLNARQSDVLLSSSTSIGLNSNTVNLDGEEYLCVDAKQIYLGSRARSNTGNSKQPVMLGHQVEAYLQDLISIIEQMADSMSKAKTIKGEPIPTINLKGTVAKSVLNSLSNRLNPKGASNLKSKKTFVE